MTTQPAALTLHLESPLRVGGRIAVLAALVAVLAGGFLAGLSMPAPQASRQMASCPDTCTTQPC